MMSSLSLLAFAFSMSCAIEVMAKKVDQNDVGRRAQLRDRQKSLNDRSRDREELALTTKPVEAISSV